MAIPDVSISGLRDAQAAVALVLPLVGTLRAKLLACPLRAPIAQHGTLSPPSCFDCLRHPMMNGMRSAGRSS